jgi:mRNA interferase RelE/StbE
MAFTVIISKPVQKQVTAIPKGPRAQVVKRILELKDNPRPQGCIKIRNTKQEYRISSASYRVRYEVQDKGSLILLLHVAPRATAAKD